MALTKSAGSPITPRVIFTGIVESLVKRNFYGFFEVGVHLIGSTKALMLNKKYRDQDYIPEVLSFPLNPSIPKNPSHPVLLGDIFLCLPVIQKRARSSGHTVSSELQFLASHATDHLLGFHHKERKQWQKETSS
jgi:probable rRNA maturation factor